MKPESELRFDAIQAVLEKMDIIETHAGTCGYTWEVLWKSLRIMLASMIAEPSQKSAVAEDESTPVGLPTREEAFAKMKELGGLISIVDQDRWEFIDWILSRAKPVDSQEVERLRDQNAMLLRCENACDERTKKVADRIGIYAKSEKCWQECVAEEIERLRDQVQREQANIKSLEDVIAKRNNKIWEQEDQLADAKTPEEKEILEAWRIMEELGLRCCFGAVSKAWYVLDKAGFKIADNHPTRLSAIQAATRVVREKEEAAKRITKEPPTQPSTAAKENQ